MNQLPVITNITNEIKIFLKALQTQLDEQKLFQFLNGLEESYSAHRSHLLMLQPLLSMDEACKLLHQEENQREILKIPKEDTKPMAIFSKRTAPSLTCTACGRSGHQTENCWSVVGFPSWHPLAQNGGRGRRQNPRGRGGRWTRGRGGRGGRSASNV